MKMSRISVGLVVLARIDGLDLEALVMAVGDFRWPGLRKAARLSFPAYPTTRSRWVLIADLKETI